MLSAVLCVDDAILVATVLLVAEPVVRSSMKIEQLQD